ncbi:DUF397 domain-containing protein [Actinomadura gamaensis]|uniref:DUF397 domain-containing protein n=1 Tax=Actinomadura gamaensis TaxID=1763541 RepID=A0ABV9U5I4_9ACTN
MSTLEWRPPRWRRSSFCGQGGGDCVEVALADPLVTVRDSRDPSGPKLAVPATEWRAFTATIKARATTCVA